MSAASEKRVIVLITGSSTGIGFATVQALLTNPKNEQPYTIILTSRSLTRAEAAVNDLRNDRTYHDAFSSGDEVVPAQLDVNNETSVEALKRDIEEKYGRLDILVNNAGTLP